MEDILSKDLIEILDRFTKQEAYECGLAAGEYRTAERIIDFLENSKMKPAEKIRALRFVYLKNSLGA